MVYTMYIPALCNIHGICMIYTIHVPCKIFIRVPDIADRQLALMNFSIEAGILLRGYDIATYDIVCQNIRYRMSTSLLYDIVCPT